MALMVNNRLVACQEVTNIRYRQMCAMEEKNWREVSEWHQKEVEHCRGNCPKCNPTWFASDLWPGQEVTINRAQEG